jgi:hypothetical protein
MSGPTSHHGHPSYKRTPGTPGLNRTTGNEDTVEEKDVVKFHNGETTSFSQLVREHHRALTALARTLVTDGGADDKEVDKVMRNLALADRENDPGDSRS